jgi:hypothetical protein
VARFALVLAVLLLAALPATAAADGWPLSGYWPMYEGKGQVVHDISGNGNHGRLGSSRSTDGRDADWTTGLLGIGSALRFDGNDYISIPDDASLHQQRLTVEAWARRDGTPGQWKYIVAKGGDGCDAASYGLYSSINGGAAFYVYDGRQWHRSPQAGQAVWDGKWHHLAGTYDGSTVRLYVDGREIGTGTPFAGKIKYEQPFDEGAIGAYRGSCKLTFSGIVDEVRIWREALPVAKIWSVINSGLGREPAASLPDHATRWFRGIVPSLR